ncbi:MFS transporter [Peptococcaceae bacterium]|nr:MFS transporter [Peptococcaceae bacterium]
MKWKIKLLVFFYYATVGILIPFLPLFFKSQGFDSYQIGILLAIGPFVSILVQSPWGYLSDRRQTVKKIILLQLFMTLLLSVLLFNLGSFHLLILVMFFFCIFALPLFALVDSLILAAVKETNISFGRYRLWGSLGFALTAAAAGAIISLAGIELIEYLYQGLLLVTLLLALLVNDTPPAGKPANFASFKKLLANRELLFVLLLIALVGSTNKANDAFIGIFMQSIGGNEAAVGWAWMVGPLSEMVVFAVASSFLVRYNEIILLALASAVFAVRWLLFAITGNPDMIIIIQLLHGLSFGLLYISAVSYLCKVAPPELRSSGMGLIATFGGGVAGITGSLLGGLIMDGFGPQTLYWICAFISLLTAVAFMLLATRKRSAVVNKL